MTPNQEPNAGSTSTLIRGATPGTGVDVGAKDGLVRLAVGSKDAPGVEVVLHVGAALKLAEAVLHEARLAQMRADRAAPAQEAA